MCVVSVIAELGCGPKLTSSDCEQLLDRYVEKLIREEHPRTSTEVIGVRQDQARALAHADPKFEFSRCSALVDLAQFRCAMHAETVDAMERCLVL